MNYCVLGHIRIQKADMPFLLLPGNMATLKEGRYSSFLISRRLLRQKDCCVR